MAAGLLVTLPLAAGPGASHQSLVYVAIGASDAVGIGADDPAAEGWVPQLAARFPADTRVLNLGISGITLAGAIEQELPAALAARPDLVTVWACVNDFNAGVSVEQYGADLDRLLRWLRAAGPAVYVGNMPDLTRLPRYAGYPPALLRKEIARWNRTIAAIAARYGAVVVDLFRPSAEVTARPELLARDGFHPSAAGYARIASLFHEAMRAHPLLSASP